MSPRCEAPIPFEDLVSYHLGELDEARAGQIDEHYFTCAYCTERLESVAQLHDGVSALVHGGQIMVGGTLAMVEHARARGIVVREYRTDPGERVQCTAGPNDDLAVTRYGGLSGITSVDVHFRGAIVGTDQTIEFDLPDAPVDQRTGDLVLMAPGALNRSFPALDIEVRLTAHAADGPHEAGPYYYQHRPWDLLDAAERDRRAGR